MLPTQTGQPRCPPNIMVTISATPTVNMRISIQGIEATLADWMRARAKSCLSVTNTTSKPAHLRSVVTYKRALLH